MILSGLCAYRFSFGYTVNGGGVLLQHDKAAHA